MKNNICVLSIDKRYSRIIGKHLSDSLDMFFADINALIQFDIIDLEEAESVCGLNYIKKLEESKVKNVLSYDNTLLTLNSDMLNTQKICDMIKDKALVIFLDMDKKSFVAKLNNQKLDKIDRKIQIDMFEERTKITKELGDIVIDCSGKTTKTILSLISKKLFEFYKNA